MLTVFTATDIITDVIIIAMPIPMVCKIRKDVLMKILTMLDMVTSNEHSEETRHQRHVSSWTFVSAPERLCMQPDNVH